MSSRSSSVLPLPPPPLPTTPTPTHLLSAHNHHRERKAAAMELRDLEDEQHLYQPHLQHNHNHNHNQHRSAAQKDGKENDNDNNNNNTDNSDNDNDKDNNNVNNEDEEDFNAPNTEYKPLKAVMRRSSSNNGLLSHTMQQGQGFSGAVTGGGTSTNSVIYSSNATSESATQRRLEKERHLQMENMQRQMDLLEQKNLENIKQRRKLTNDLDTKMRECKFYEKQVIELTNENQQLKAQLESTVRVSSGIVGFNTSVVGTLNGTKRGTENGQSSSNKLNSKDNGLVQELRQCREKMSTFENDNRAFRIQNSELTMQVKILQDALNFRSEEIGLSGHADLLTKVAKLRGEVTALKNELVSKSEELESVNEVKSQLHHQQKDLNDKINAIQQRLAQAQQDAHRYANSDVSELLKTAEQERDVLIEFVQSDLQKSNVLAKQVETLESEIRIVKKKSSSLEEKLTEREAQYKEIFNKTQLVDKENHQIRDQFNSLQRACDQIKIDRDSLQHQLDRKITEEEEIIKGQVTLFSQLKSKDEELLQKSQEFVVLKMKLQEFETSRPHQQEEMHGLKSRNQAMEKEVQRLRHIIHELEPKVKSLEPMIPRFEKEMEEYRNFKLQSTLENQELKQYKQLVEDLHKDLDMLDVPNPDSTFSASKRDKNRTPTKSSAQITASTNINPSLSRSQQHSMWIGLPSLRNLSSILYDKIRTLANDLHQKETECNDQQQELSRVQVDLSDRKQTLENLMQQSNQQHQHDHESLMETTQKLHEMENEAIKLKEANNILQQIKLVLLAYPGQKPFALRYTNNLNDEFTESIGKNDKDTNEISDLALPDLINQTLLTNAQAVLTVRETTEQNASLQSENDELKSKWQATCQRNTEQENQLIDVTERLSLKERRLGDLDYEFQCHMNDAAELAEKQNALMMTLEAKVEGLQRDRQLRIAQIQALQQREESLKQKIVAFCDNLKLFLPPQYTNDSNGGSNHLAELILYVLNHYVGNHTRPQHPPSRSQYMDQPTNSNVHGQHYAAAPQDLPDRHRSSSPVMQPPSYDRRQRQDELLRPISTRISPLKSTRMVDPRMVDPHDQHRGAGRDVRDARVAFSHDSLASGERIMPPSRRSADHQYQPNQQEYDDRSLSHYRDDASMFTSSKSNANDVQDRLRRARMSFSSMKEM